MYKNRVVVNILGKNVEIQEIPFFYLKSLIKDISYNNNITESFESLISFTCHDNDLNYLEKIIVLLHLRTLTYGDELEFTVNKKDNATVNINDIIDIFDTNYNRLNYEHNNVIYTFDYPKKINLNESKINFIADSLVEVNGKTVIGDISDRIDILPAINFIDVFDRIISSFYEKEFNFKINNTKITLLNILYFIKSIFSVDMVKMYDMEYTLRKYLNFNTEDFKTVSLPECKILLNCYISDQKKQEQQSNQQLKDSS
tara:strand:+ start:1502 stop:2272 length:771 start_codon:yes stop_codon:yes gene_type:complete